MKKSCLPWNLMKRTAAIAAMLTLTSQALHAGDKEVVAPAPPPPAPSKVNFLLAVEFANEYVTPRGMIVREDGLTIQPLLLMFVPLYQGDSFINSVKFVGGAWNDFGTSTVSKHPPFGSVPGTNWTEIDPIAGLSIGFAKHFTLDATYTAFAEQILDIGTSQHLEVKLSFDDSAYLKGFALHPYVSFWQELDNKATAADVPQAVFGPAKFSGAHPQPGSSFYFDLGVSPSYTFSCGAKIEAPCRILLPDSRFYGEYFGKASTVGLYELGLKGTIPMKFMPEGYGHWNFNAGFKYMSFVDKNLQNMNAFNAPGQPTKETWQFFSGFSAFF